MTSQTLPNATSSPESAGGLLRSHSRASQQLRDSGQDPALASLSARQAAVKGRLTSGTYGPPSTGSSTSATLQSSLESRLARLLEGRGSTLYRLTWKPMATPSGRRICALRASAPRISDKGSTGWQSPAAQEAGGTPEQFLARKAALEGACGVSLTSLSLQAATAAWPTPNAMPPSRGGLQSNPEKARERRAQGHMLNLDDAACLASWPTPTVRDHKDGASAGTAPINALLGRQVWTVRGPTLTGSCATIRTVSDGAQLNPELSRWLMGFPKEWASCGVSAMQSFLRSPRRSSKQR
jgi:hypothetical protein